MSRELICSWLKITPDTWPPDHYTLVGLARGESDAARIERHIHERHEWLLRYQLNHPEQVTEAMNRLALAFVCLTDPKAKRVYDATLLGRPLEVEPPPRTEAGETPAPQSGGAGVLARLPLAEAQNPPPKPAPADPLGWLYGPWTEGAREMLASALSAKEATPDSPAAVANGPAPAAPPIAAPYAPPPPVDPVVEAAQCAVARRGLGTKRALYFRISRTRQLIRAWVQAGRFIGDASAQLRKKTDAVEMVRQLTATRQLLREFPPLLGNAGQPGYLVIALARQPMILQTFLALLPSQREALVRDWQAGLALLAAHRLFLREELWGLRRQGRIGRALRAVRSLFADHPGLWLLVLGLAALNLAYAPLREAWPFQAGALLMVVILSILLRGMGRRRALHRARREQA